MPSIAAVKWIAAITLALAGIALLALGLTDAAPLERLLASRAPDGSVSPAYVAAVQSRARVCGGVVGLVAVAVFFLVSQSQSLRVSEKAPARLSSETLRLEDWKTPLLILAAATLARAALLARPLHYDEAFTFTEFASRSPLFFLTRYTHANNHVFHTLLVWLMPGEALPLLRLPAFVAGIGVVALTYLLGRKLYDETTALLAAALAAGATPLVEYSAQGRGYTILTFCFLALFLIPRERWWLSAIAIALGCWTMPTMVYAVAAWAAWVLVRERRVPFRELLAGGALTFLLYVPILVITGLDSITANGNVLPVSLHVLSNQLPVSLAQTWLFWNESYTLIGGILLAACALFGLRRWPLLAALVVPLLLTIAMRRVPFPRVWTFLLPLYLIAAATTLAIVARRWRPPVIAVLLAALVSWSAVRATARPEFFEDPAVQDGPAIATWAATLPADAQILVTTPLDASYSWYLRGRNVVLYRFDSDPSAVRAALTARDRYLVAGRRADALRYYRELQLPATLVPVKTFRHSTVYAMR